MNDDGGGGASSISMVVVVDGYEDSFNVARDASFHLIANSACGV